MKRTIFAGAVGGAVIVLAASCSQQGLQNNSDSGKGGASGSTATGGATPTGGASGTGQGGVATGGAPTGGASGTSQGGVAPTGGAPTGGAGGSGAAPTGGTDGGGMGGTVAGTGGSTTTGGTDAGGQGGTSGTAGAGGSPPTGGKGGTGGSGGSGTINVSDIVPTFDGYMWIGTCSSGGAGLDCTLNNDQNQCPNNTTATPFATRGAIREVRHTVGGTQGTKYMINFEVRGIAGGKFYTGGMQRTTTTWHEDATGNDGWYVGGTPTDSKWNTYEIHVEPAVPGEANTYYLNGFPVASGADGRHETVVMKYSASFAVLGGGTIRLVLHDSNCLGQQNCGQTVEGQAMCTSPRMVDLAGMSPQPMNFAQPYTQGTGGFHPQWLFFDVKSVTAG